MGVARRVAVSIVMIVLPGVAVGPSQSPSAFARDVARPLHPARLAIYHGFPSLVNGSEGDLTAATEVFQDYDLLVFGDGLQDPAHPDHANTAALIATLKASPNATAVYGYLAIGVTTANLSIEEIRSRVDAWRAMGTAGIFIDEADYAFGVSRPRQNEVVDYVHSQGFGAFINAFDPGDVFSPAVHLLNPEGLPTHLGSTDVYLHESFQIILGEFQDPTFWASKSDRALAYQSQFGTRMAVVTTVSPDQPGFDAMKFEYAWWSALLYGFDAVGWGEPHYSAGDNRLPFRARPDPGDIGGAFASAVTHAPPVHTRTTASGTIEVNTDTHVGTFTLAPLHAAIDILPGTFPNRINPSSSAKIPVAILTTDALDAGAMDPSTVRFGPSGTEAAPSYSDLEDVDGDGDLDMLLGFRVRDTGFVCGDIAGSLTGETFGGRAIEGSDSIETAGCK